ncbi:type II secretion system minor pseudopilin GspI [Hyphomonas sp. WL0036]|uniref:type II secretion system minor pseudopilin GspI n=1 Tax=Hyphomonas sediminis TaxID=2866160 RepID=UPI001C7EC9A7|nr:type II secretion system minor pseudopilin GspI [Hyphomonas sediminis]MBY9067689.1 type II secretion system minor pseudopilin GspI [Hyphomonas sediminis]
MKAQQGFSLMEALVALAVFSTAAVGLLTLNTNSVRISAELGDRALARQVAENIAVDTITNPQLQVVGRSVGTEVQRKRSYTWERVVSPAPRDDLIQIEIRVRAEDAEAVLGTVSLLHRVEPAA